MLDLMEQFRQIVWEYYRAHGRHDLPWRQPEADGTFDPYKILVSELMLQQTQVPRVLPKFESFVRQFPTIQSLADATLAEVVRAWNGLGYNRRAKFLWQSAGIINTQHGGVLPSAADQLVVLPGVGVNTAGALAAYAYNRPVVFIETNIRTVFIYHFFADKEQVSDKEIADVVAQALPDDSRHWYWALMDYGTHLKQTVGNSSAKSRHYVRQSAFEGSRRQVRGQVLRILAATAQTQDALTALIVDERLPEVLEDLKHEGFIVEQHEYYRLADR